LNYCSSKCSNIVHGKDEEVQKNKVLGMRRGSLDKHSVDWPSKAQKFKTSIREHYDSKPKIFHHSKWTDEQHHIINNELNALVKEHSDNKITLRKLSLKYGFSEHFLSKVFKERELQCQTRTWNTTLQQRTIADFLESLDVRYEINNRNVIKPKEIDIYLPDYKIEWSGSFCWSI
jgi:YesN/AraC family two-component response regulator